MDPKDLSQIQLQTLRNECDPNGVEEPKTWTDRLAKVACVFIQMLIDSKLKSE